VITQIIVDPKVAIEYKCLVVDRLPLLTINGKAVQREDIARPTVALTSK
jgi:hypothetical protein